MQVKKEILKTLSHIGTEVNSVKNNTIIHSIFIMGSFCFYEGMPNYQRVMATLNKVSKLRGNFLLQVMKGHLNIATFNEEMHEPLKKVILEPNLSLSQFPILPNSNQRALPSMKSADPWLSSTTLMEVD